MLMSRGSLTLGQAIKMIIIVFWLVMMTLLIQRVHFVPDVTIDNTEFLKDSDDWRAINFKGQKIGYSHQALTQIEDGYVLEDKAFLRLNLMGQVQELRTVTTARVSKSLGIKSFSFFMSVGPIRYQLSGNMTGLDMELISVTGGHVSKSNLQFPEVPRLAAGLIPFLVQKGLSKGQRFKVPLFDPATLATKEVQVLVEDQEKLLLDGKSVDSYRLRQEYADTQTFTWVDTEGRVLKEEGLMGLSVVRTTEELAQAGIAGRAELTDVIAATAAPANRHIDRPRDTRYLKVRLKGVTLKGFELDGHRQKVDNDIVEIIRETIDPADEHRVSPSDSEYKKYLIPLNLERAHHPKVLAQARSIAGQDPPLTTIRKVTDWVYTNLEKRSTMSVPDPVTALDNKVGDCKEHAALAAALLQALGIPTRVCVGVLYFQDGFYYHAWVEVYWGQWLAVDPLLNQIPADATHIRFLTGGLPRQTELIRLIGRLELEILTVK